MSAKSSLVKYGIFLFVPVLNYFFWFQLSHHWSLNRPCRSFETDYFIVSSTNGGSDCEKGEFVCATTIDNNLPKLRPVLTKGLVSYKADSLINIRYPEWSILLQPENSKACLRIVNPHITRKKQFGCLALVTTDSEVTYNLLRYEVNNLNNSLNANDAATLVPKKTLVSKRVKNKDDVFNALDEFNSTGFFENVANDNGRIKLSKKMTQFLGELPDLETHLMSLLAQRDLRPGADVVVMVVNTGEIDLLANFVCSCHLHNISLHNVVVFAGSADIVPVLESFGVVGVYHKESFANVSANANYEYLDPIFIDMMWYKSFSVWLLLKLKFNVLFQDVDVIWFRSPFQLFRDIASAYKKPSTTQPRNSNHHNDTNNAIDLDPTHIGASSTGEGDSLGDKIMSSLRHTKDALASTFGNDQKQRYHSGEVGMTDHSSVDPPDAYLSDDGQRSLRYAPFYANSGYYYLVANERTEYFAWKILSSFDLLHITGSHQNIFTIGLMEGLDYGLRPKMLTLRDFPSGVKFNHDKPFMRAIKDGHERPYMFHMCWTLNKYDKLRNFRASGMWYVSERYSEELGTLHHKEEEIKDGGGGGEEKLGKTLMRMAQSLQRDNTHHHARWEQMAQTICVKPS